MAKYKGRVSRSDLEGGYWQLESADGTTYKLEGGSGLKAGVTIEVEGAVDGDAMGIGFGSPVLKVKNVKIL
jgi:hypothetical protein